MTKVEEREWILKTKRKYELQTDEDRNRKMEKKFQIDRKKTIKQRKSAEMYLEINNTSLERSEPYYALYSMKI